MEFIKEIMEKMTLPMHRPDENKFCWSCMKRCPHEWIDGKGFISIPKWRCRKCGTFKRASLWDICK